MRVEGLPIWKTERACCLLPCALVAVCEVDWYKRGYLACRLQRPQSQNQMRVSIAVNGRNSALSISDYSAHTSRMPCPRQGLPRSRNVHACCLLSSVCDGHYSVSQNKNSCLHLGPKSPNQKYTGVFCRVRVISVGYRVCYRTHRTIL